MQTPPIPKPDPSALIWLLVSGLVVALDQATKYWALTSLPEYTPVPVIKGLWNWSLSYNTGVAFSLFAGGGAWQQIPLVVLALGVVALLVHWLRGVSRADIGAALPYALMIGGALSNVVDRLSRGHVVDFIQWHWRDYYWPTFNLSDSAIVIGAAALVLAAARGHPTPDPDRGTTGTTGKFD